MLQGKTLAQDSKSYTWEQGKKKGREAMVQWTILEVFFYVFVFNLPFLGDFFKFKISFFLFQK